MGLQVRPEDVGRVWPLGFQDINVLGRSLFIGGWVQPGPVAVAPLVDVYTGDVRPEAEQAAVHFGPNSAKP